jgi:predicted GIY-YIG superfamily endonuclease
MPFYVYIIQSLADKPYYKGYTEEPVVGLFDIIMGSRN